MTAAATCGIVPEFMREMLGDDNFRDLGRATVLLHSLLPKRVAAPDTPATEAP